MRVVGLCTGRQELWPQSQASRTPARSPSFLDAPALSAGWEPDRETALAIFRHARENLAPYLRIRRLEFFELPKTVSGKIRRVELRRREREEAAAVTGTEWRDDAFPELTS